MISMFHITQITFDIYMYFCSHKTLTFVATKCNIYVATEVERSDMKKKVAKKLGRPLIGDSNKDIMLRIRVSESDLKNLDKKCKKEKKSRSELLREFMNS